MRYLRLLLASLLLLLFGSAKAEDNALQAYFSGLKSFQADFEQMVFNAQLGGETLSKGKLYILRPGKFRWDYLAPYEQQIVSDGEKIWMYDTDLEQVTVKPVTGNIGNTPALLLSEDTPLQQSFNIKLFDDGGKLSWYQLKPKADDTSFTEIRMGLTSGGELQQMILKDNLGQTTQLTFSNTQRNKTVPASLFDFVPPKGVDVFEGGE